jgi:malonyl-CoA decarboxylase
MVNSSFFSDLLASITERGRGLLRQKAWPEDAAGQAAHMIEACETVLSGRGEASGAALSRDVLDHYAQMAPEAKLAFFEALAHQFGAPRERLDKAVEAWRAAPSDDASAELHFAAEPRRQELFRRLNRAPGGTSTIVRMRADMLALMKDHPDLAMVDRDFAHLLASWFNRGFLVLKHIDWSTPAAILEKIIRYEAVHEIRGWADLRRRIDPEDRRCYAFFHPALVDEPLIFVEVALTEDIPGAIAPLLAADRAILPARKARCAVFYSISNCQAGLAGISFGNFLIKQVVTELRREFPRLESFVTLSPVPGFRAWLRGPGAAPVAEEDRFALEGLDDPKWLADPLEAKRRRKVLEPLAAHYFLEAKNRHGRPLDAVARFHLGNGARLERINWGGDVSDNGMRQSAAIMVNYLYELDDIEKNHEAFANQGVVVASAAVRKLAKGETRLRSFLPG